MALPENLDITAYAMLGRYFLWSQTIGELYANDVAAASDIPDFHARLPDLTDDQLVAIIARMTPEQSEKNLVLLSYWYASLFVVVEGWRTLALEDQEIGRLLQSPHVETLRRYRNGAFHFQTTLADARFVDMQRLGGAEITVRMAELRARLDQFFVENTDAAIIARGA